MHHRTDLTPEEKQHLSLFHKWARGRYLDYAKKKGLDYTEAVKLLIRKPFSEQIKELDNTVDAQYHSSNEPKMKEHVY